MAIAVSKSRTLDFSVVKAQSLTAGFLFLLPLCHCRNIFTDQFVTARVIFGIAFSIRYLSPSVFLGLPKKLWNRTPCPFRIVEDMFKHLHTTHYAARVRKITCRITVNDTNNNPIVLNLRTSIFSNSDNKPWIASIHPLTLFA